MNVRFSWAYMWGMNCGVKWQLHVYHFEETPDQFPKWLHHFLVPQHMRVAVSSHPCQHLLFPVFFILSSLVGVNYLVVPSVCIPLMTDRIEHLGMCLLATYIFFGQRSIQILHLNFELDYLSFCLLIVQLISLTMINSRFIHDVACTKRSFLFIAELIIGHNLSLWSPVDGHLSCLDSWWIWTKLL